MASAIYPEYMEDLIQGTSGTSLTGTLKVALIDTGTYTYDASDEFLSDISGVVGTASTLASKTYANGILDAADITDYAAGAGNSAEAAILYLDTGVAGTSRLVAYIDGFTATPSGVDTVAITWHASGIISFV